MRARLKNKIVFLLIIGILSFMPCLIMSNSSQVINSTSEKVTTPVKTSAIEDIRKLYGDKRVNDYLYHVQWAPSTCALSSNSFAVAWHSMSQDGDGYGVYATVIDATTGKKDFSQKLVNYNTTSDQAWPSICALSSDSFAVAWQSDGQDGSNEGIYTTVIDATSGNNVTSEIQVNYNTTSIQGWPSTCALSSDSFVVTWMSKGQDGDGYGIYATVINATTGKNVTSEIQVNYNTTDDQKNPSTCALSSDSFVVAWWSEGQDGSGAGIYATVINATTESNITTEFRVNDYTTGDQKDPSTCALSSDSFAVAWESYGQDGSNEGIYVTIINITTGATLMSETQVNIYTIDYQKSPSICALSSDSFAVVWDSQGQGGSTIGVYATVFGQPSSSDSTFIPGYDPFVLLGIALVVSAFLVRKRHKFNS